MTGASPAPSFLAGSPGSPHILWAEDLEGDRRLIRYAMEEIGERPAVQFVPDGPKLLATLDEPGTPPPDLLVLDLNMPGLTGIEVLKALREKQLAKDTPVVIFSSSTNLEELAACSRLGAAAIVHKPMQQDAFNRAIARIVKASRKRATA